MVGVRWMGGSGGLDWDAWIQAAIPTKNPKGGTHVRKPPWLGSLIATQRGSTELVGSLTRWKCASEEREPDMWTVVGVGLGGLLVVVWDGAIEEGVGLKSRVAATRTYTGRGG